MIKLFRPRGRSKIGLLQIYNRYIAKNIICWLLAEIMKRSIQLIISLALPLMVGALASFFTVASVKGWYATIQKPSFNPPNSIFGPVWSLLYVMMGIAFYLIWIKKTESKLKTTAILFYCIQLALNFCWSLIFFYGQQPGWALVDIVLLWIMIAGTIYYFSKISKAAAWMLVPYILWVSFATALNFAIWKLN